MTSTSARAATQGVRRQSTAWYAMKRPCDPLARLARIERLAYDREVRFFFLRRNICDFTASADCHGPLSDGIRINRSRDVSWRGLIRYGGGRHRQIVCLPGRQDSLQIGLKAGLECAPLRSSDRIRC